MELDSGSVELGISARLVSVELTGVWIGWGNHGLNHKSARTFGRRELARVVGDSASALPDGGWGKSPVFNNKSVSKKQNNCAANLLGSSIVRRTEGPGSRSLDFTASKVQAKFFAASAQRYMGQLFDFGGTRKQETRSLDPQEYTRQ